MLYKFGCRRTISSFRRLSISSHINWLLSFESDKVRLYQSFMRLIDEVLGPDYLAKSFSSSELLSTSSVQQAKLVERDFFGFFLVQAESK
mmetsp:Transcript_26425/g.32140  ORF Transcript_26425/g.32140 Transcript_26425/m.32140 type:complete len:90 (+) Transcript_26425:67-336(+)